MKKEIAVKWAEALRGGKYEQHTSALANRDRTRHCCLGVLCELAIEDGVELETHSGEVHYSFEGEATGLPGVVMDWADMDTAIGQLPGNYVSLDVENDTGMSFGEIADLIERHWEAL